METKNKPKKLERIRRSIGGLKHRCHVNLLGIAGGLSLWWNDEVDICIFKASANMIHTICKDVPLNEEWYATFLHTDCRDDVRCMFWEENRDLSKNLNKQWFIIGDFNNISAMDDKEGGDILDTRKLEELQNLLLDCELSELSFKGPIYT